MTSEMRPPGKPVACVSKILSAFRRFIPRLFRAGGFDLESTAPYHQDLVRHLVRLDSRPRPAE